MHREEAQRESELPRSNKAPKVYSDLGSNGEKPGHGEDPSTEGGARRMKAMETEPRAGHGVTHSEQDTVTTTNSDTTIDTTQTVEDNVKTTEVDMAVTQVGF